jgi:2-amino-4-hydroxy-6-hydroxymethyldihydropteridine diphosphokinase
MSLVFLSLGSNLGESANTIHSALRAIEALPQVYDFIASSLYRTAPVSPLPQPDFLNAACSLRTHLTLEALFAFLNMIEEHLGKIPKPKEAPRPIDIDIVLFGLHFLETPELCIPHPCWRERFFVLMPLAELTDTIVYPINTAGDTRTLDVREWIQLLKESVLTN